MMMDCPRCGFAQPKDRYCANCGLDVEHFLAKPKPLWLRLLQNPNLHLSLIGILMILVVGYILYSRSHFVAREVRQMFGTPLSSREAADPDQPPSTEASSADESAPPALSAPPPATETVAAQTAQPGSAPANAAAEKGAAKDPKRIEITFWEVARGTLNGLVGAGEKVGESNEGRMYFFRDGARIVDAIGAGSRKLGQPRSSPLQAGSQVMLVTPSSVQEPFQFGVAVQVTKWENKESTVRWDSQLVLSQPETAAEMASQTPVIKAVVESTLTGSNTLTAQGLLLMVIDPNNRHPRDEYVTRAGEGPWTIFTSEDFRNGVTDWVMLIQLR